MELVGWPKGISMSNFRSGFQKTVIVAMLCLLPVSMSGCLQKERPEPSNTEEKKQVVSSQAAKVSVKATISLEELKLAFLKPTEQRSEQVIVGRALGQALSDKQQLLLSSLHALIEGPNEEEKAQGLFSEIPPASKLLGFDLEPAAITVNFNNAFTEGGGSYSVQARWAQVKATVEAIYAEKEVKLLIEGEPSSFSLGGEGLNVTSNE